MIKEELSFSEQTLKAKKIILYPTDTVWGIGCDATNEAAVAKIYKIKNREESKSLVILVSSLHMLKKHVSVSNKILELLTKITKPTTIIYENPKGIALNAISKKDNTVAIRIVQDEFCRKLIKRMGVPIVSTSANISGKPTPKSFTEIEKPILNSVDYIVNLHQDRIATKSSTILKIKKDDSIIVLRE